MNDTNENQQSEEEINLAIARRRRIENEIGESTNTSEINPLEQNTEPEQGIKDTIPTEDVQTSEVEVITESSENEEVVQSEVDENVEPTQNPPLEEPTVLTKKDFKQLINERKNSDAALHAKKEIIVEKEVEAVIENITIEKNDDEGEIDLTSTEDKFSLSNVNSDDDVEVNIDTSEFKAEEEKRINIPVKIGSTGDRKSIKRITNLNPGPNIKVTDTDEYQKAVIEQYITRTKGEAFIGPKSVTRVILPYSGIFYDITSYTNSDMLGIHRSTSDISFVEKIEKELYSAWEHTINNSFKRRLEFGEWLTNIKYPDLWCIYWGIYNVNHPGINTYTSNCDHCPNVIEEKRDNYGVTFVSDNSVGDITQDDIDKIRNGVDREFINSYKISSTIIEKEGYLPDQNFKVFQGMPNMEEVLTFLKYLKVDLEQDDEIIRRVLYPISWLDLERHSINKSAISKILAYKYSMFTRKLYVPVYENMPATSKDPNAKPKVKATYVNVKPMMIPPLIEELSKDDFKELVKGRELRKMMMKDGIHFRVKDSVCPKCKKKQLDTALDMRDILFTRAETMTEFLIST